MGQGAFDHGFTDDSDVAPIMVPVDCPTDFIGDNAIASNNNPFTSAQQKFNSFYTQVKNTAQGVKHEKLPSDCKFKCF